MPQQKQKVNDCLYAGPSFGQRILDILIRFRIQRIALIADIEKAFRMISVAEEDRDVLRFLWLDDINSQLPRIQVLRFARVVFGVASSPFLLNATLKHHIERFEQLDREFVKKFQRSIYVDDITFGADNVKETYRLYKKSKSWLADGGFNLRKYVSNSPELQNMGDTEEYQRETPSAVNNGAVSRIISAILSNTRVAHYFADIQVEWSFNLEKAPWWGGFFERMIKSMKGCLKRVIGHARLTFDELVTVVIEVEATLNSRPLSYVSPDDLDEPLTPAHLLTGHRLTSLPDLLTSNEDTDYTTPTSPADITRRVKHLNIILSHFWKRWRREYLSELRDAHRSSSKGHTGDRSPNVGDIVVFHDDNHPRLMWKLGKVEGLLEGHDGIVRGALVRVHSRMGSVVLKRPVQLLYPLEICDCEEKARRAGKEVCTSGKGNCCSRSTCLAFYKKRIPSSDRRAKAIGGGQ